MVKLTISPPFYEQLLHWYSFTKKLQKQTVSREKMKKLLCKKLVVRCWWNWHMESVSPNCFCKANSYRHTAFGKKIAIQFHQQLKLQISSLNWCTFCQMCLLKSLAHVLMKSTPGGNFINILRANFLYEHSFGSFSLVTCT